MSSRRSSRTIKRPIKVVEQEETQQEQAKQKYYKRPKHGQQKRAQQHRQQQLALPAIALPPDIQEEEIDTSTMTKEELADFYVEDNPFYQKYFYTPNDFITNRCERVISILQETKGDELPVFFQNGIINLAVKPNFIEQPPKTVLFSKLSKGDYETKGSKSDKTNITSSIKFFRKNLSYFQQYTNEDNLNYIIYSRRLLIVELLEYYSNKPKWSLATFKSRLVAIIRIFRIAYGNKDYIEYEFLSLIIQMLGLEIEDNEGTNKITDEEAKKFLDFRIILNRQKELEDTFKRIQNKRTQNAYDFNQDLLLLSLYSLIPPLRNEIKTLEFTTTSKNQGDYIYFKQNGDVILLLNEEKKRHEAITYDLTKEAPKLASILRESYDLYPRQYLFTPKRKYPDVSKKASTASLDDRLYLLFREYDVRIGTNSLRSSYVSNFYSTATAKGKQRTYNEQKLLAERMRTSIKYLQLSYNKIIDRPQVDIKEEPNDANDYIAPNNRPSTQRKADDSYLKQLQRNKIYYEANKAKIIARQAQNALKNKGSSYRVRVLQYLNNNPDYINKVKPDTITKYGIKQDDEGRYF